MDEWRSLPEPGPDPEIEKLSAEAKKFFDLAAR